ncbi:hypothetical protein E6R60_26455 [Streptomyces sp. A0642]|uniref:hypothetical protein n=1 Tax=Streptomyces sp. A0642 TaxID=2563100 RepID=UPI0010A28C7C|nr:hypothetical protein [Streptomyces sp. A0642]THA72475.1 hypothetical protein E6R60_26455 [Streptomyces sp. A0642]
MTENSQRWEGTLWRMYVRKEPSPSRRIRVVRPYTDKDYRQQRMLMVHGGAPEEQERIPARPWSPQSEVECREARLQNELDDYEAEQLRRSGGRYRGGDWP